MQSPGTSSHAYAASRNAWPGNLFSDFARGSAFDVFRPLKDVELALSLTGTDRQKALERLPSNFSKRPLECFVDSSKGTLGPYLRWLIALRVLLRLQHPPETAWTGVYSLYQKHGAVTRALRECAAKAGAPAAALVDRALESYKAIFLHGKSGAWGTPARYLDGPMFQLLRLCLDRQLSTTRYGKFTVDAVQKVQATYDLSTPDPGALQRFEHWVLHGFMPPRHDVRGLVCEPFLAGGEGSERDRQLKRVLQKLHDQNGSQPIINVHQRSGWAGLRAFATTLVERLTSESAHPGPADPPTVIYIPVFRGDRLEKPDSATAQTPEIPPRPAITSPRGLQRALCAAFSTGKPQDSQAPTDASSDDDPSLDLVRRGLTLWRTVVVVDAIDCSVGPMASLFDTIRNTQWADLLRVVAQPHMDAYLARNGLYTSKLVILSGERLIDVGPWCAIEEPLASIPPETNLASLLQGRHDWAATTRKFAARFGLTLQKTQLARLYPLQTEQRTAILEGRGKVPSEVDLALACLLDPGEIQRCHGLDAANAPDPAIARRKAMFATWLESLSRTDIAAFVAFGFIAGSVNGMRRDTLSRSMERWLEQVDSRVRGSTEPASATTQAHATCDRLNSAFSAFLERSAVGSDASKLGSLAKRFQSLLVEARGESVEALGPLQVMYELRSFPDSADGGGLDAQAQEATVLTIDLRQNDVRELFFAEMMSEDRHIADNACLPSWRDTWELIHLVLSEESLRQATSQIRTLPLRNFDSSRSLRRLIQAAFHGLQSNRYGEPDRPSWHLPGGALPPDPEQRFAFLYLFVFRHGIENAPEWALGRAFAQTELRFALMSFFVNPGHAVKDLSEIHAQDANRRSMHITTSPIDDRHSHDRGLRLDVLEAYGRAALDSGRVKPAAEVAVLGRQVRAPRAEVPTPDSTLPDPFGAQLAHVDAAREALGRVREWLLAAGGPRIEPRDHLGFLKLDIDTMFWNWDAAAAGAACRDWLPRVGLDVAEMDSVCGAPLVVASGPAGKHAFDKNLERYVHRLLAQTATVGERTAISDILSRLAEATLSSEPASDGLDPLLLRAYSLYFVADSLRSMARSPESSPAWPMISGRPVRHYVRLCFRIARALAAEPGAYAAEAAALGRDFYAHGRARLDAYSRHLFRLPRERASMLLLMADAARTWAESQCPKTFQANHVRNAWQYIESAHSLLCDLGFPVAMACRLLYDRRLTARMMATLEPDQAPGWLELARRDTEWLKKLAEHDVYWKRIVADEAKAATRDADE